ncbi:exosome non-catalytic core subunit rrp40 [Loxospora ochrophaea]|nr:exosome non-catalytic core subunit rrp40 [Loxospora ochrophaea]
MEAQTVVLPGDRIEHNDLLGSPGPLRVGPGLRQIPTAALVSTVAGSLCTDEKKNALWIDNSYGRYIPQLNDVVLATVHHSSTDFYHCALTSHTTFAQLPQLAFEGATKKTRPQLSPGSLVYARVSSASKHVDPEIVCCNLSTGKSEGMGELKGGMVFDISLGMARRLLMSKQKESGGIAVLEEIAEKFPFEIAVGRNGRIWVNSGGVKEILIIGRAIQETDKERLDLSGQKKLLKKLLREI